MQKSRKVTIVVLISISVCILIAFWVIIHYVTKDAELDSTLLPKESEIVFYDRNDQMIRQEDYARSDEISDTVKQAFIAIEDKRFYHHHGIDVRRLVGALFANLKSGSVRQGGSTITCQLVKNTHLTNEKTIERKLKEAKIALQLEKNYDKDQILEMYLNAIYFGNGIYGIKTASYAYFNKSPDLLNPREAATLAAIIANPTKYNPRQHLTENQQRADLILSLMEGEGYLDSKSYSVVKNQDIILNCSDFHNNYCRIYTNSALFEVNGLIRSRAMHEAIRVYTYLDPEAESAAKTALDTYAGSTTNPLSCELILADNSVGGVLAYLSTYERKGLARQPGSLLKPFVYSTAIENDLLIPATQLLDEPINFSGYTPQNYNHINYGWVDAEYALSQSLNIPAVKILQQVGIENAYRDIERCGISLVDRDKNLSLALGGTTYGSLLTEICGGYMTLASQGNYKPITFIREIRDATGRTIYRHTPHQNRVFAAETAYLTTTMLKKCAQNGTAKQLSHLPYDIAAKTGTVAATEGNSDAWCAGYTSDISFVCRYSSKETSSPLPNTFTGGNIPTKTVRALLKQYYNDQTPQRFYRPTGIKTIEIDGTIKEELHKIVPYTSHSYGEKQTIVTTAAYSYDSIDLDALFFQDLAITPTESGVLIRCREAENVEYRAYLNGKECVHTIGGFLADKLRFPLARLEILCLRNGKTLYKKDKIVRVGQSLMISTEARASLINAS